MTRAPQASFLVPASPAPLIISPPRKEGVQLSGRCSTFCSLNQFGVLSGRCSTFCSLDQFGSASHLRVEMKVSVVTRNGKELIKGGVELDSSVMVSDLQQAIYSQSKKFYPARQRLTLPPLKSVVDGKPVVLHPKKKLIDYAHGNENFMTVVFKDLGPQVSYRTLFFWEYLGPLLIYPIFYFFPVYNLLNYEQKKEMHPVQTYALYYWSFHYSKRIMETFFVHRFSHDTSPLSNVYRNCAYYWTFAACIAYSMNHPLYSPVSELQWKIGFTFGLACQISNLYCHIILKQLRSSDGVNGGYRIPRGFLFNVVTCANYSTEIYQWLGFNIATQTLPGYLFLSVGTYFMYGWAIGKHRRLNKLFDGKDGRPKYPKRWVFLPPFF